MALEDTEKLINAAEVMANLMNEGLSQEAAEQVIVNQLAEAQAAQSPQRRGRGAVSLKRGANEANRAAAEAFLAENDAQYDFTQERTLNAAQMGEYGQTESDFQIQSADDKNIEGRDQRRLRQQVETNTDKLIKAQIEQNKGRPKLVEGIAEANKPVGYGRADKRDLQKAAILMDLGLAFPEKQTKVKAKKRPDGTFVRRYGRQDKKSGKEVEFKIGADSARPNEFAKPASSGPEYEAFVRLAEGLENGTVDPNAIVNPGSARPKTAAELYETMSRDIVPSLAIQREKGMTADMVLADEARVRKGAKEETLASLRQERADIVRNKSGYERELAREALANLEAVGTPPVTSRASELYGITGALKGYLDPQGNPIGEANDAQLDNALNAPQPRTRAQDFALRNAEMMSTTPGNYGPAMVNTMEPGRRFMNAAANVIDASDLPRDIRSLEEFDQVVDTIINRSQAEGREFYQNQGGKQIRVSNPGVDEVLNSLRIPSGERTQLANALIQMEQLRGSGFNQGLKDDFEARTSVGPARADRDITFDPESMRGAGNGQFEKVNNEKIKGKGVGSALRGISEEKSLRKMEEGGNMYTTAPDGSQVLMPEARDQIEGARDARRDARVSLQGVPAGGQAPRAAFIKQKGRDMSPAERSAAYGPENAAIMNELMDRYEADEARRSAPQSGVDPVMESWRQADAAGEKRILESRRRGENAEIDELVKLAQSGRQYPAVLGTPDAERTRAEQGATSNAASFPNGFPDKLVTTPENQMYPAGTFAKQPIQQAGVPATIALDPGVATGNQPAPAVDAGRGSWMGGGNGGRIVNPWQAEEPAGALVSLKQPASQPAQQSAPGGYNVPAEYDVVEKFNNRPRYMTSPDYQETSARADRRQVIDRLNKQNTRRRVGGAAAGAGALAGLAALIGGEREERDQEQEVMYR